MKAAAFLIAIVTSSQLQAQTTGFPPTPNGLPASPVNPGLPASPVNPGLPGFQNSFAPFFTNRFGTNVVSGNLNQMLVNLQGDLAQLLPVLTAANNSFDFVIVGSTSQASPATGTATSGTGTTAGTTTTTAAENFGHSLGANTSANFGTALGQDLSSISSGRANAVAPAGTAMGANLSATGVTNAFGLQPTFAVAGATNTLAFGSARDVLRALLLLQDDVERMLPLVNALNGGTPATLGVSLTNNFGTVPTGFSSFQSRTPALTPTGR